MHKNIICLILLVLNIYFLNPAEKSKDRTSDVKENEYDMQAGNELTIIGTQEKTQQIEIITKEEIEKINPADTASLLEKSFNLNITRNGSIGNNSGVSIRGFGSGRVAILLDGVPLNSVQSGEFDLSNINVENIEKIEVVRGGSDTKYNVSGAIGGVINIITKKKNVPGLKVNGSISNTFYYPDYYFKGYSDKKYFSEWSDFFDTQKTNFGFGIGNNVVYWDVNWSGERATNNYIYKDNDGLKRRRTNNQIWDSFSSSSLMIKLPQYSSLMFSGDFNYNNKNIPGPMGTLNPGKEVDYFSKATVLYDSDFIGCDKIDTELIINYNFSSIEWIDDLSHNIHNLNTVSAVNRWGFNISEWLYLNAGGDFEFSYLDSDSIGKINNFNGGGYLTAEFAIKKFAKIIPSVKLIYYKEYPVAIPKLGLIFFIGKNFTLKNNFFRTFKLPTLNEMYWPEDSYASGNPNLKFEDGFGGDFILSYHKEKILRAESSVYINYHNDAIIWQPGGSGKWIPDNVGRAMYFGTDNNIKSDFSKYIKLFLSYSYLMTFVLNNETRFEDDKRMPYMPVHTLGFGAEADWGSGNINILGHYVSERYTTTLNVNELKPYFNMDINFSQKIKLATIFCSVKNILNTYYFLLDGYPMPGGSVTIGVKFNYDMKFKKKDEN